MKKYWAIFNFNAKRAFEQRLNMIVANFQSFFTLFILVYFWKAVFQGKDLIRGYTFPQMITHYFLFRVMYNRTSTFLASRIAKTIKSGEIAKNLIMPVDYIFQHIFGYMPMATIWTLGNMVTILAFSWFLHSYLLAPASFSLFLVFLITFFVNGVLVVLINLSLAFLSFWLTEVTHLKLITTLIISLLSGGTIPLGFFPLWAQRIINLLPFKYLIQFPISIYLGRLSYLEIVEGLALLILWSLIMFVVTSKLFRKGLKVYEVSG